MRNQLLLTTLALFLVTGFGRAEVEDVPIAKLPAAVVKAVKARFPTAKLDEATRDVARKRFAVTLKADGRGCDVTVTETGSIERIDREVTAAELPPVKAALDKAYPKAALKSLIEVTRVAEGKEVADGYRAYLDVPGDRPIVVRIERDGTLKKR